MEAHEIQDQLLAAILPHVAFDGWTASAFNAAVDDAGVDPTLAKSICPRGAVDLAVAFHKAGDRAMLARLATDSIAGMRYSEKVAALVRYRLEAAEDKEAVRRGATLFALPQHSVEGAGLIWGTADAIWTALGDTSDDINWYSKRAILSGVYGSTVLYWLGDDSIDRQASWEFLDRRIAQVMQIEKAKSALKANPITKPAMELKDWLGSRVKRPSNNMQQDLPGGWLRPRG